MRRPSPRRTRPPPSRSRHRPCRPPPLSPPPAATTSPASASGVDIYSWLPFTQQGLAAAAAVTEKFLVDYNTYSYRESAAAFVGRMNGLITTQLASTLRGLYAQPGVAKLRTDQRQVSTGSGGINSIRAFGAS